MTSAPPSFVEKPFRGSKIVAYDGTSSEHGGFKTPVFERDGRLFKALRFTAQGIIPHAEVSSAEGDALAAESRLTRLADALAAEGRSDPTEPGILLLVAAPALETVLREGGVPFGRLPPALALTVPEGRTLASGIADACARALREALGNENGPRAAARPREGEWQRLDRAFTAAYRLLAPGESAARWRVATSQGALRSAFVPERVVQVFDTRLAAEIGVDAPRYRESWLASVRYVLSVETNAASEARLAKRLRLLEEQLDRVAAGMGALSEWLGQFGVQYGVQYAKRKPRQKKPGTSFHKVN